GRAGLGSCACRPPHLVAPILPFEPGRRQVKPDIGGIRNQLIIQAAGYSRRDKRPVGYILSEYLLSQMLQAITAALLVDGLALTPDPAFEPGCDSRKGRGTLQKPRAPLP